jgi:integrase/recombinase XerD
MNLKEMVDDYIGFRQGLGERCKVNGNALHSFCRAAGEDLPLDEISPESVSTFLAGKGPLTASWHVKHNALVGFYRYALSRGLATTSPLPTVVPKRPATFQPYIYTQDELHRLFEGTSSYQHNRGHLDPRTMRAILLLLYGAALRSSEALALTLKDVDLDQAVLTVRESKFFKSRLVPIGLRLTEEMRSYHEWRTASLPLRGEAPSFFSNRHGQRVNLNTLQYNFERLRAHVGLQRDGGPRLQPRMHDLRHSSAVHRLTACYRRGGNVQRYVEHLSVYMGHANLSGTQTYLTMTPQLLAEASVLFERYVNLEAHP